MAVGYKPLSGGQGGIGYQPISQRSGGGIGYQPLSAQKEEEAPWWKKALQAGLDAERSLGASWTRQLTELPMLPQNLLGMAESAEKFIAPKAFEPYVESKYRPLRKATEALTPDAVETAAQQSETLASIFENRKRRSLREAGAPEPLITAQNIVEEATVMAADPLEIVPGGALASTLRKGQRVARRAPRGIQEGERMGKGLSPEAIDSWIGKLGKGDPGLARETVDGAPSVVYRGPDGTPVSGAVLTPEGDAVDLVFTDKRRGMLSGRAAVEVGRDLKAQGVTRASGEISEDALRARDRLFAEPAPAEPAKAGFWRRYFTKEGQFAAAPEDIRSTMYAETQGVQHNVQSHRVLSEHNLRRFNKAVKDQGMSPEQVEPLAARYLSGEEVELPGPVQMALDDMREHMDSLAQKAIDDESLLSEELAQVYGDNLGRHMTRSYEVHYANPDDYIESVRGTDTWRRAYQRLAQEKRFQGADPAEIEGALEEILRTGPQALFIRQRQGVPSLAGALSKRRKDIPREIRDLMGEIVDPKIRYARTVERLAHDTALSQALQRIEEIGDKRVFFDRATGGYSEKIPGEAGRAPLGGKYTSPGIAKAISGFQDLVSREPGLMRDLWGKYLAFNAGVKSMLTVGNPSTHFRNELAWGPISLGTGNPKSAKNLAKVFRAARGNLTPEDAAEALGVPVGEVENLFAEAVRLGVGGQSVIGGHLQDYSRLVRKGARGPGLAGRAARGVGRGIELAKKSYALEDDLPKVSIFLEELGKHRKALPDMPEEKLKRLVAEKVRDTTPTWDQIPEAVRELGRDMPLVGAYPGFYQQMVQSVGNTLKWAFREMKDPNPAMRQIGRRRLGGLTAAITLPTAASLGSGAATGVGFEQWRGRRETQAPWDRDSELLYLGDEGAGRFEQVNLGYIDPYGILKAPVIAAIAEGSVDDARWQDFTTQVVWAALEPFLAAEPVVDVGMEIARERNPTDSPLQQAGQAAGTAAQRLVPLVRQGTNIAQAVRGVPSRSGRTRKPWQEIVSSFGLRISEQNMLTSLYYDSFDFGEERNAILRKVRRQATDPENRTPEEAWKAMNRLVPEQEKKWREIYYPRMRRKVEALKAEGVPDEAIFAALEGSLPNDIAGRLVQGADAGSLFGRGRLEDWMGLRQKQRSQPWWDNPRGLDTVLRQREGMPARP